MAKPPATDGAKTLERLEQAQIQATFSHQEQTERVAALAGQVRYMEAVVDRFIRRRDHLLAAGEENPDEARQAAELAATAERLRKGAQSALHSLAEPLTAASERSRKSAELLTRIRSAVIKLKGATRSLELVRLEKEKREALADLERTSMASLQQLGQAKTPVGVSTFVPPEVAQPNIESYVREVTLLAYEAEALADLQREYM